jgi:hypothetical protein
MAGITLIQAEAKLAHYLSIEDSLGANAEVTIDGTTYKRHNLKDISAMVTLWNERVIKLTPGSTRVRQVIPR